MRRSQADLRRDFESAEAAGEHSDVVFCITCDKFMLKAIAHSKHKSKHEVKQLV